MSVISIITKNIVIEPKHLNYNIKEYVYNELKKKYERTCCDEYGLIIEINEYLAMDNIINKDSIGITFTIKFKALTLKPVKGLVLSFIPYLIQQKGIFGKLYNNIHFFIPENNLINSGYVFNPDENYFNNENDIIDCKSEVNVMIDQIQYDTTKYNCITKLIKTDLKNMD